MSKLKENSFLETTLKQNSKLKTKTIGESIDKPFSIFVSVDFQILIMSLLRRTGWHRK